MLIRKPRLEELVGKNGMYCLLQSGIDENGDLYRGLKVGYSSNIAERLKKYITHGLSFRILLVVVDEELTESDDEQMFHNFFRPFRDVFRDPSTGEIMIDLNGNPKPKPEHYIYTEVILEFFENHTDAKSIRLAVNPVEVLKKKYQLDDDSIARQFLALDPTKIYVSKKEYIPYDKDQINRAIDLLRACQYRHIYRNGNDSVFLDSLSAFHKEYIKYDPEIDKNLPLTIAMLTVSEVEEIRIILSNSHSGLYSGSLRSTWEHNIFCILVRAYTRLRGLQSDPMCNIDAELNDRINKSLPKALYLK